MFCYFILSIFTLVSSAAYALAGHELFTKGDIPLYQLGFTITSGISSLAPLMISSFNLKSKIAIICMNSVVGGLWGRGIMQNFYGNTQFVDKKDGSQDGRILAHMPFFGDQIFASPREFNISVWKAIIITSFLSATITSVGGYLCRENNLLN